MTASLRHKTVPAIGPGTAWDADLFARRVGAAEGIAAAAMLVLTNTFTTGVTLHVDGGERLA